MSSHRSESDWQGLLSEVRRRGGRGPGRRAPRQSGGRARLLPRASRKCRGEGHSHRQGTRPAAEPAAAAGAAGGGRRAVPVTAALCGHVCRWPCPAPAAAAALRRCGAPAARACEPPRLSAAQGLQRAGCRRCCYGWFDTAEDSLSCGDGRGLGPGGAAQRSPAAAPAWVTGLPLCRMPSVLTSFESHTKGV